MLGFNHVAGGFAFVGAAAAIADVNIFSEPEYLGMIWFASILPDIDHKKSLIGRVFYPIANYLDRHYGHRTITHSLICLLFLTTIVGVFEISFFNHSIMTFLFCTAYLSHLIFDMCTLSGIPFFYPFTTDRCVLPANAKLRIRAGDFKAEVIIFFAFMALNLSMIDLVQEGVLTKFQKNFRQMENLHGENKKSLKFLEISGISDGAKIKGLLVESSAKEVLIFRSSGFKKFKTADLEIIGSKPTKYIKAVFLKDIIFDNITLDSLKSIISHPILLANIQSNNNFKYFKNDLYITAKSLKVELLKELVIEEIQIESDNAKITLERDKDNLKIAEIQASISRKQAKYQTESSKLNLFKSDLSDLNSSFPDLSDYNKGKAIKERERLKDKIDGFTLPDLDIETQLLDIELLRKNLQAEAAIKAVLFSGRIKYLNYDRR